MGQAGGLWGSLVCVTVWTFVGQSAGQSGGPWGSLDVCGAVWTSVWRSECLCGSLNVCGAGWRSVGQAGGLWGRLDGCLWGRLDVCGAGFRFVGQSGRQWGRLDCNREQGRVGSVDNFVEDFRNHLTTN